MIKEKQLRAIIYTIFTGLIIWLLVSGRTLIYLHPRMLIFQIIAAIFLSILTIYSWYKLIQEELHPQEETDNKKMQWRTILPFFFLFTLILFSPDSISAEAKQNKPLQLGEIEGTLDASVAETIESEEEVLVRELSEEEASLTDEESSIDLSKYDNSNEANENNIVGGNPNTDFNEESDIYDLPIPTDFLGIVSGMYDTPDLFLGETVILEGFVYRDESYDDNSIVLGRLLITCCIADASIAGLYLEPENASSYATDSWIRVEGTVVEAEKYISDTDSYIDIYTLENMTIEKIEPLSDPYIYWTY